MTRGSLVLIVAALVSGSAPTAADWLVLRDGSRVETRGAWQLDGRRVVFTHPSGTLASLRLEEVDLAASEEATAAVRASAGASPSAAPRPPVLVLTDDDVSHVDPLAGAEEAGASGDGAQPGQPSTPLVVVGWRDEYNPDLGALEVFGSIRNQTNQLIGLVRVNVHLLDEDGSGLADQQADVTLRALPARRTTTFRAAFPGVSSFSGVRFETSSEKVEFVDPTVKEETEKAPDGTEEVPVPAEG